MSIHSDILKAIETDPKMPSEIAEETGLRVDQVKNNMTLAVSAGLAKRESDGGVLLIYHITEAGKAWLKKQETGEPEQKTGATPEGVLHLQSVMTTPAQPEVAHITPAATDRKPFPGGPPPSSEAVAPIEYNRASAETVQELANALDRIHELKQQLKAAQSMENASPAAMLRQLQTYLEEGVAIMIGEDTIRVCSEGNLYQVTPADCMETAGVCADLKNRLVA
jgi:hypothetical protein